MNAPRPHVPVEPSEPHEPSEPVEPAELWRRVCVVDEWLAVSGDLCTDLGDDAALAQLRAWQDAGITHILDVREEWNDRDFVAAHAPDLAYTWLGTHDDGGAQSDEWYDAGLAVARRVRGEGGRLLVHCHMGVNRAPSMALRLLLDDGSEPIAAIERIRDARPIAAVAYAESALGHHHRTIGSSTEEAVQARRALNEWMLSNRVDTHWVISRIRLAERGG